MTKRYDIVAETILRRSENTEKVIRHSERVVAICRDMAACFRGGKVDPDLLISAAWLHDVAKKDGSRNHHKPARIRGLLEKYFTEPEDMEAIISVISNHRKEFDPERFELESAILRMSDKLDKLNKAEEIRTGLGKKQEKITEAITACLRSLLEVEASETLTEREFMTLSQFCFNYLSDFLEEQ